MIRCRLFALALIAAAMTGTSVSAISLPDFPVPPTPEPTPTAAIAPRALFGEEGVEQTAQPTATPTATPTLPGFGFHNAIALNLDYIHSEQELRAVTTGVPSFKSKAKVDTYAARIEYQPFQVLSVYGIAGLHDGASRVPGVADKTNLDGWAAGVGVTAILPFPLVCKKGSLFCVTPFSLFDFNYTYNDYKDVKNGIDVYNFTSRLGFLASLTHVGFGLWAGPAYQAVTRDQDISTNGQVVTFQVRPEERWNGVIGAVISWVSTGSKRAPLSLTVEGGVGNRNQILVSLRYEYLSPTPTP